MKKRILTLILALAMSLTLLSVTGLAAGWNQDDAGWWYQNDDGSYPADTWQKIGGAWYHFASSGYMQTGWQQIDGSWYWFDGSGVMAANEWRGGYWINPNGTWTYQPRGTWHSDNSGWWFGDSSGWYARNAWQKIDGEWYYFDASGYMVTGWLQSGNTWYFFKSSGAMAANETVGNYTFGSNGAWTDTVIEEYTVSISGDVTYILNTSTMKFHKPDCNDVKRISAENRFDSTESRESIIAQGYDPCKHCKP